MESVAVVFVHGFLSSRRAWMPMAQLLSHDSELSGFGLHFFEYDSRILRFRPDRRIPSINDIADRLGTYLRTEIPSGQDVVLVSHSQGGLVVQRLLARTLARGAGEDLAPIRRVVMFACPNSGSEFLLSLRRSFFWWNRQERELRPIQESIVETQRQVSRGILNATGTGPTQCRIPIVAYAGMSDNVVPPIIANWTFPMAGVIDGDHFTLIRPTSVTDSCYQAMKRELLTVLDTGQPVPVSGAAPVPRAAPVPGSVSVPGAAPGPGTRSGKSGHLPVGQSGAVEVPAPVGRSGMVEVPAPVGRSGAAEVSPADEPPDPAPPADQPRAADPSGPAERPERASGVSVVPPLLRLDSPLRGRDELIDQLTTPRAFTSRVRVLHGLAGCGKSHVALEVARRAQNAGRRVWWVSALRLSSGMREVASQLGAPASMIDRAWAGTASATDLVWRFLNASEQRWLLIIDNADEPGSLDPVDGRIADGRGWLRLPDNPDNAVLVTTRDGNRTSWPGWCAMYPVRPLQEEDGALVLLDRVGSLAGNDAQARQLSASLGGLPLALRAVGDYLKSVHTTRVWQGAQVLRSFDDYRAALRRRFDLPPGAQGVELDEPMGLELIERVFEISLDLLARRGLTQAGRLLRVLACLSVDPVPYHVVLSQECLIRSSLFSEFTGQQRLTMLEGLADLAMIELYQLDSAGDDDLSYVLSLHPLVHGVLRNDVELRQRRPEYYSLIMDMLVAAVTERKPDDPAAWAAWYLLAPHAISAVRDYLLAEGFPYDRRTVLLALEIIRLTARYLIATGFAATAYEVLNPVINQCRSYDFHDGDREILALRHELARTALEQGRPEVAEKLFREVIEGRERVLGPADADTLASRHKLSRAIMAQNRWVEAEAELRAIVTAEDRVRGPEHEDTMVVRHSLARAVLSQGRAQEAEEMLREIRAVRLRRWPPSLPETLFARQSLARCLHELARYEEAEQEIRDALATVGPDGEDLREVLWLRWTLVQVHLMRGRVGTARTELRDLLADRRRVLGESHPDTLVTQETLRRLESGDPP